MSFAKRANLTLLVHHYKAPSRAKLSTAMEAALPSDPGLTLFLRTSSDFSMSGLTVPES